MKADSCAAPRLLAEQSASRAPFENAAEVEKTATEDIFDTCDVSVSRRLGSAETHFALKALGFYPTDGELDGAVTALGAKFPLKLSYFEKVVNFFSSCLGFYASKC